MPVGCTWPSWQPPRNLLTWRLWRTQTDKEKNGWFRRNGVSKRAIYWWSCLLACWVCTIYMYQLIYLFNYLSMFFIYVLFLFMHSFICKCVNKPTSPCRVALHWRFLPKWEFKVGTSIDPWYIQDEGFPVPSPIDQNRHVVVMSFVGMLRNCVWVLQMCEHVLNRNTIQTTI